MISTGNILSIIANLAIVICTAGAVLFSTKKGPLKIVLRYFTTLSNILCAAAALAVVIARLCGTLPMAVLILKYMGTSAVTVTMLTVLFFLGPRLGYKMLLTGPDLFLHLVCPILAIVSFFAWDVLNAGFAVVFLGMLPLAAYAVLYVYKVLLAPEEKRWPDFYGYNRNGKWLISVIAMLVAAFLVSLVLWLL